MLRALQDNDSSVENKIGEDTIADRMISKPKRNEVKSDKVSMNLGEDFDEAGMSDDAFGKIVLEGGAVDDEREVVTLDNKQQLLFDKNTRKYVLPRVKNAKTEEARADWTW